MHFISTSSAAGMLNKTIGNCGIKVKKMSCFSVVSVYRGVPATHPAQ